MRRILGSLLALGLLACATSKGQHHHDAVGAHPPGEAHPHAAASPAQGSDSHPGHPHDGLHHGGPAQHRFDDAEAWAKRFEDPGRDAWQKPDEVIAALALEPLAKVADIGAATGYFPVRLARALPRSTVYGVDIEPTMVKYLAQRARVEGLSNLVAVLAAPDDPKLPEPVDLVLVVNTYHHIEQRPAYFRRLAAKLRPKARLAIVDFRVGSKMGPPDEHKVPAEVVVAELDQAGYALDKDHGFLPEQHFLVFQRK